MSSTTQHHRPPSRLRRLCIAALASLLSTLGTQSTLAQEAASAYPSKPVRIVVPFSAGGAGDVVTRIMAQRLSARMGQPFIVENKPGAGGATGAGTVVKAPADGYTLGFVSSGHAWLAAINPNLGFNPSKDLQPIALICSIPYVFLTRPDAPFKTVPEFIAYAKAHPGKLSYASAGVGTLTHLLPAWLFSDYGLDMTHIPYGGTAPAMNSLIGGQVDVYFDPVATSVPQVQAGKVRALATTGDKRTKSTADIPTLTQLGYPVQGSTWFGLMAPASVPKPIIEKIHKEVNAALEDPEVVQRLQSMDISIEATTIASFAAFLDKQTTLWTKVVKDNKIKSD